MIPHQSRLTLLYPWGETLHTVSWYLSGAPRTPEYGTRLLLCGYQAKGHCPHMLNGAQNASGPVGIPLKGAPQAPGDKRSLAKGE